MAQKLPYEFLDLNEMGTSSRGVSVLYGRRADGSLVAINVDDDGTIVSGASFSAGSVAIKDGNSANTADVEVVGGLPNALVTKVNGSTNAFFADQTDLALTGTFQSLAFGFTSFNITFLNDSLEVIEMSFDGTNVHHRFKVGEGLSMDYRAQSTVWLRTVSGNPAAYRLSAY